MGMSMDDGGAAQRQGFGEKEPRWDEKISWFQFPDDTSPYAYRLVAKPFYYGQHWLKTRKKDGTQGKPMAVLCRNYDSVSGKPAQNGCKVCEYLAEADKLLVKVAYKDRDESLKGITRRLVMASNAIVRDIQSAGPPANNTGKWTFVHPIKVPQGFADTIAEKQEKFNKVGGVMYGFSHKDHGRDLLISYNSASKEPAKMYQLDLGDKTALKPEELQHGSFLVDFLSHLVFPADSTIEQALQRFGYYEKLQSLAAGHNLQQVGQSAQAAPAAAPQAQAVAPGAFDDGGGLPASSAAPAPAVSQQPGVRLGIDPALETDVDMPQPAVAAPVAAPVTQPAVAAAAPVAAPAPVAAAPVADLGSRIAAFAQLQNIPVRVSVSEHSDMRNYKSGMSVPQCFEKYDAQAKCKPCPIRLDCMMATP